jgi:hypothetical protein
VYTLANVIAVHIAGGAVAYWLLVPNSPVVNAVTAGLLALTVAWFYFVVAPRARRLTSPHEDLSPNLITHGGLGMARWDRRSLRQDEPGGAETRAGNSV